MFLTKYYSQTSITLMWVYEFYPIITQIRLGVKTVLLAISLKTSHNHLKHYKHKMEERKN